MKKTRSIVYSPPGVLSHICGGRTMPATPGAMWWM